MKSKVREKTLVIALRKKGFSYREIVSKVGVSKSSVSLWLQDSPLTEQEKRLLKTRSDSNISRGRIRAAGSLRAAREVRDRATFETARDEFKKFYKENLFQVGLALYWAEGSKRNSYLAFANSDPGMVNIMLKWITLYLKIKRTDIYARLYLHKPYADEKCEEFWSKKINIPLLNFKKTVCKSTNLLIKKRPEYKGCIRIEIYKVYYFRKLKFWLQMFLEYYKKQG